jgi:hypothetical protein
MAHVRNEHANVQIRINGIMLPDGISGFGTFLDTALIGNISLITGELPPQFGLRTSGVRLKELRIRCRSQSCADLHQSRAHCVDPFFLRTSPNTS